MLYRKTCASSCKHKRRKERHRTTAEFSRELAFEQDVIDIEFSRELASEQNFLDTKL